MTYSIYESISSVSNIKPKVSLEKGLDLVDNQKDFKIESSFSGGDQKTSSLYEASIKQNNEQEYVIETEETKIEPDLLDLMEIDYGFSHPKIDINSDIEDEFTVLDSPGKSKI